MIKIGSGNWIVDNLNSALETWNGKLTEIWQLISTTPEEFKGGGVWNVIVNINGALQAIGYALLVLFFVMGVVKTCGSFTELKKPEMAFKCFVRFILAQAAVMYGMELMTALFRVAQGMVSTIMDSSGLADLSATTLPDEMVAIIESVGLIESIPLWAITLLGSLFIWVLALVMILTVYSRFFKLYSASGSAAVYGDGENPVVLKSEFLLSLCEQLMGSRQLSAKEKSIIDRCTAQCYHGYIRGGYQGSVPTLRDFHAELLRQPEPEARDVALAIELFTEGSLNTFAKPTNVDTNSRILCYDIRDLGKQLLPVGMLVVLDSVFNRIIRNRRLGRSTWVYIDEIYVRPEAA